LTIQDGSDKRNGCALKPLTVKTKDWEAGRRWAKRNAIATPGVTFTLLQDGRHLSYRYEDGLMYCTGHGKRVEPYRPWAGFYRKGNEFMPISNIGH
jgi:hypothetical protein